MLTMPESTDSVTPTVAQSIDVVAAAARVRRVLDGESLSTVYPAHDNFGPNSRAMGYAHDLDALVARAERATTSAPDAREPIGYFVWANEFGVAFRGKLHGTVADAEAARASVVWHNRPHYRVRPVYLGPEVTAPTA